MNRASGGVETTTNEMKKKLRKYKVARESFINVWWLTFVFRLWRRIQLEEVTVATIWMPMRLKQSRRKHWNIIFALKIKTNRQQGTMSLREERVTETFSGQILALHSVRGRAGKRHPVLLESPGSVPSIVLPIWVSSNITTLIGLIFGDEQARKDRIIFTVFQELKTSN